MEHLRDGLQYGGAGPAIATPGDIETWVARLGEADLPILRSTARRWERLALAGDDRLSPHDLAELVMRDPLMTARLFVHVKRRFGKRDMAEITTANRIIVMLGVPPVLRAFQGSVLVEQLLSSHRLALKGLTRVILRARRASAVAGAFAALRNDPSFDEIMAAALLHDMAEMLVWCYAPALALETRRRLEADPALRSAHAQEAVLGVRLMDLQLELVRRWRLPPLLVTMMDDDHAGNPRVRNVMLAVNIARHSAGGWENAALPDDYRDAAALLSTTPARVEELVRPQSGALV